MRVAGLWKPRRLWGAEMSYLSRTEIEKIADRVITQYKKSYIPERRMCYRVDVNELAAMLGYRIIYTYITKDGSVLGQTSNGEVWTTIYNDDMKPLLFLLDGKTILVEKRLQANPKTIGRMNFTIAHELAHQLINELYPEYSGVQNRVFCDYRRSVKPKVVGKDWYEWQADALASALLLPLDAIQDAMFMNGLGDKITVLSRRYSEWKYRQFCQMADYLQVSRTALSYRMEQFGLLERNRLVKEAQARKGAS